jgi:toxin YoeB
MAKRLIWTKRSQKQKEEIFEFWNKQNKSKVYSRKLNDLFDEAAELVCLHPNLGKKTNFENVRLKLVRDYWLVYRVTQKEIQILIIWDARRNPDHFKNLLVRSFLKD